LDQDVYARCVVRRQYISDVVACFVHALKEADVSGLDEMETGGRADSLAFLYDGLGGFLIATNHDDSQSRSVLAMGFAEFSDCEFSDAVGRSYENSSKWLSFDERAIGGSNGCELDHYGKYGERCQENACPKA
jgi:hypothetical protein